MKAWCGISVVWAAMALAGSAFAQDRTLARLNHESTPEVVLPHVTVRGNFPGTVISHSETLSESALSRSAATALFVYADLGRARQLAQRAWRRDHRDAEALFVRMEVAAMQADEADILSAAMNLCAIADAAKQDPRVELATARVRESAANTPGFRAAIPRIQTLLANSSEDWPELSAALPLAAMDGVPGLDAQTLARASGILTDWRIVGPLRRPLLDFDQAPISPNDDLTQASYENRAVENFQFPDGIIRLPSYLSARGIFYAAGHFASLVPGAWTVRSESAGALEIYVDGEPVLRQDGSQPSTHVLHGSARFEVPAGPHRVLAKFAGAAAPLRIALSPAKSEMSAPLKAKRSVEELTYELAASAYAAGEFGTAIQRINTLTSAATSAAVQFLLAQAWTRENPIAPEGLQAWSRFRSLAPGALAGDQALARWGLASGHLVEAAEFARRVLEASPNDVSALETLGNVIDDDPALADSEGEAQLILARRLAEHPSCETSSKAVILYRSQGRFSEAAAAQQKLDGCAPESLLYVQSLASQGRDEEAIRALQQLLAAAPLNRSARLMLVRELQLAGDDSGAERAAASWLRIAPNASAYRRLAAAGGAYDPATDTKEFYAPYRRDAVQVMLQASTARFSSAPIMLVDDHVAVARSDGSVSLYVHSTTRFSNIEDIQRFEPNLPRGARMLQLQTLHCDGGVTAMQLDPENPRGSLPVLSPGDAVDEEYVVNYSGDGGIPEHPEVFQFVFGRFDEQVLSARFVVLTPAGQADRGAVIASSDAPRLVSRVKDTMLARVWERNEVSVTTGGLLLPNKSLAIVRVVEQENGWTIPSDAEHHRRIETIHPGPRFEESSETVERGKNQVLMAAGL